MTAFWIAAGVLLAGALAFLLVPLTRKPRARSGVTHDAINVSVYRDQLRELDADLAAGTLTPARHAEAVGEIERAVLEDTRGEGVAAPRSRRGKLAAVVVTIALPVIAGLLYFLVGTPHALAPGAADRVDEQQIVAMVERLAARLAQEPENPQGWAMLGRSYSALGRFDEAASAYGNAVARGMADAQLFADYADAVAMAQGRRLEGEPEALIAKALALDPENIKALALAGSAAYARADYARAVMHWEKILRVAPKDSELAQSVRASIDDARALAAKPKGAAAKSDAAISGIVELAPELARNVAPEDTVFVFARAVEGPRAPVAILRARAGDLPLQFTLDDRSSVMAGAKLSDQERVIVGARVSKSGNAAPQPGDLQGYSAPVAPGTTGLRIVVSEVTR